MIGLRQFTFPLGDIRTSALNDPARLLQRQYVGAAGDQLLFYKRVRLLVVAQRLFGDG